MSSTLKVKQRAFLNLFPAPEFLMLSTSGVSITDYDTKFVELKREVLGDGFRLVHSSQSMNPKGAVTGGLVTRGEEIISILKEIKSHHHIRYTRATLPDERSYVFTATIDRVPKESMRDAVAFIVEENAPVSLLDSVFDFTVVDKQPDKFKVAVSVLSKDIVSTYIDLFERAGITPVSFDVESQAIARAVIQRGDKTPYLLINFYQYKTGFYIVENGAVQFSTTVALTSDVGAEMRKVLTFWEARHSSLDTPHKIEKAFLCGKRVDNDFVASFGDYKLSYERADAWVNLSASSKVNLSPEIRDESLDYAAAIGSALSGRKTKHV